MAVVERADCLGRVRAVRARRLPVRPRRRAARAGTSRSTCPRAAPRRAARPRPRSPACCTSASATSASARRSPSWATTAVSAISSALGCARRGASAIAPCGSLPRSCASSRWPSPRASRPGRSPRAEADFSLFKRQLERLVSLRREEADAVGYEGGERYDALLDQYEPDMRVARLEPLLHGLRDELVPFVQEIAARPRPDDAFVHRDYPAHDAARGRRPPGGRDRLRFQRRAPGRGGSPLRVRASRRVTCG